MIHPMENELCEGDLTHIPSGIFLYDPINVASPRKCKWVEKPCVGVFLGPIDSIHTKVYVDGEYWAVSNENVYKYNRRANG